MTVLLLTLMVLIVGFGAEVGWLVAEPRVLIRVINERGAGRLSRTSVNLALTLIGPPWSGHHPGKGVIMPFWRS